MQAYHARMTSSVRRLESAPRQLDLFRDRPDGDMRLLLAVLEQEAMNAAARGHVRDVIRELSALRDALADGGP